MPHIILGLKVFSMLQVLVNKPLPDIKMDDSFQDTILIIDMIKQQTEKNNQAKKVSRTQNKNTFVEQKFKVEKIRNLAIEQKKRKEEIVKSTRRFM